MITANFALENGREVFAIPGPIIMEEYKGNHRLIQEGAKLITSSKDILEEFIEFTKK
ncbi:putative Rossmann fold nucleotide-binding protein DprA/Smf involved in DNA uptake [Bacillus sp. OAE603]